MVVDQAALTKIHHFPCLNVLKLQRVSEARARQPIEHCPSRKSCNFNSTASPAACACTAQPPTPPPPQISHIYEFQDAEEYDCKAVGFHPREAHVRIGSDVSSPALASASPLAFSKGSSSGSPSGPAAGAPNLLTDQEQPISLTATLLLGNDLGRCVLPEALFRVRRYDLMTDETRELFVRELRLALLLPSARVYRKFAGAWLDGVHGLLL
jgi:hypothetical protein